MQAIVRTSNLANFVQILCLARRPCGPHSLRNRYSKAAHKTQPTPQIPGRSRGRSANQLVTSRFPRAVCVNAPGPSFQALPKRMKRQRGQSLRNVGCLRRCSASDWLASPTSSQAAVPNCLRCCLGNDISNPPIFTTGCLPTTLALTESFRERLVSRFGIDSQLATSLHLELSPTNKSSINALFFLAALTPNLIIVTCFLFRECNARFPAVKPAGVCPRRFPNAWPRWRCPLGLALRPAVKPAGREHTRRTVAEHGSEAG